MVVASSIAREQIEEAIEELTQKVDELEALAKQVYDEEFNRESPNNQIGDTRIKLLNMWANIGRLCRVIRDDKIDQMRICFSIAKDIEKELEGGK